MKTRNNQSHADETLLNQSITRRSFVKRSAVASAATVFGVGSLLGNIPSGPNPYIAKVSLGFTVVLEEGTIEADVADMTAAAVKLSEWGAGEWKPGEADPSSVPDGSLTLWDETPYDTRYREVYSYAPPSTPDAPVVTPSGASTGASITITPNAGGGFHVKVVVPPGGSITIDVQTQGIRDKYMDQ